MDELEIAVLKDKILNYLHNYPNQYINLENIKKSLNLYDTSYVIIKTCIEDMEGDVLTIIYDSGNPLLQMNREGEKLLSKGGYAKPIQERRQLEFDQQMAREKTNLEIKNLKWGWWFSIAAMIISIVALLVSIFKN
jgi:hypothetical protein